MISRAHCERLDDRARRCRSTASHTVWRRRRGEPRSEQRDFADALARAEVGDTGPDLAIANYPGPAGPFQQVALEHVRIVADKVGQATLRRGWVLHERVEHDPAARAALEPMDRVALQHYEELDAVKPLYDDPKQGEIADDLAFGTVQLTDSPASAVDPNTEATFMNLRLHKAVGLPDGTPLSSWAGSPAAIEALTEFETMYADERPGGVHRGALAQLAEIYYRALREVEQYKGKLAENEGLASIAATVAGVVVAVGTSVPSRSMASGGDGRFRGRAQPGPLPRGIRRTAGTGRATSAHVPSATA